MEHIARFWMTSRDYARFIVPGLETDYLLLKVIKPVPVGIDARKGRILSNASKHIGKRSLVYGNGYN